MKAGVFERRTGLVVAYCALLAAALAAALAGLAVPLDQKIYDAQTRFVREQYGRPATNDVVVVGLDEAFLDSVREPVALLHPHLARFLSAMMLARPSVVGFDIVLPERSYRFLAPAATAPDPGGAAASPAASPLNYDLMLIRALLQTKQQVPLVLGKTWNADDGKFREILVDYVAAARRAALASNKAGADVLQPDGDPRGSVLVCPDADGTPRRYPDARCQPDGGSWNLSSKMAAYAGNAQLWSGYIDYGVGGPFNYVPLGEVLRWFDAGDEARLAAAFRGRMVLLGPILQFEDRHRVPVELAAWEPGNLLVPGVLIHAQALRSIMGTGLLQPAPRLAELLLVAAFTLLWWLRRPVIGFAVLLVGGAALVALSTGLLLYALVLPITTALAAGVCALALRFLVEAIRTAREKSFLKSSFSGYVSPQVLREILSGRLRPGHVGRARACVLFADIRGFTSRSETMPPERLVALLNRYFGVMSEVIHKHRGTVDKFIGDGIMAFFGAPEPLARPEQNAIEAAQEMLERLGEVNAELAANGEPPLRIGIGLHSGDVIVGHVGSRTRHEYTAIGEVVNIASRLEGLTKSANHPIVVSESVAAALGHPQWLLNLGEHPVAGSSPRIIFGWTPAVLATA